MEVLSPQYRTLGGVFLFFADSLGKIYVALIAMFSRDWQVIIRSISLPMYIFLTYYWLIPESTRWLLNKNRNEKAAKILLHTAKINNNKLSESVQDVLLNRPENITSGSSETQSTQNEKFTDIFKYPKFCIRILVVAFCWIVNVCIDFGLTYTAVAIGGNKYTDFIFITLVELPCQIVLLYIADRFGRRSVMIFGFIVCGCAMLGTIFLQHIYIANLILFVMGKFAIGLSWGVLYLLTPELFPTSMRQTLMGVCSSTGRIGSIIASQWGALKLISPNLPKVIFAGFALTGAVMGLTIPETLGIRLSDTLEEAAQIGNKKSEKVDDKKGSYVSLATMEK